MTRHHRHRRNGAGLPILVGLGLILAGCESAQTHYTRGLTLSEQGRHDEAFIAYEQALALAPDDPGVLYDLGMTLIGHGYGDAGVEAFDRVIAIEPDHVDALFYRAVCLKGTETALASLDRVLELRPDFARAHMRRGDTLGGLGRLDEALLAYHAAATLAPDDAEVYSQRGAVLNQFDRYDEALRALDRALELRPTHPVALMERGIALEGIGRPREAIESYWQAAHHHVYGHDVDPYRSNPRAHFYRARALAGLGRDEEALAACDLVLKLRPDDTDAAALRDQVMADLVRTPNGSSGS